MDLIAAVPDLRAALSGAAVIFAVMLLAGIWATCREASR